MRLPLTPPDEPAASHPTTTQLLRRLFALGWRFRGLCFNVLAMNLLLVVVNLGGLSFTGLGIDVVRAALQPGTPAAVWPWGWSPPSSWSVNQVMLLVAGLVLLAGTVNALLKYVTAIVSAWLSQAMVYALRTEVYDHLQRLSIRFFDEHNSSSIIGRVTADVQSIRGFVDGVVLKVLTVVLSLCVYLAYMLSLHVPLTIACLCSSPLLWVGAVLFSKRVRPLYLRSSELSDRAISVLAENVQGIQVVKSFAKEGDQTAKFATANEDIRAQKFDIFWQLSVYQPMMGLVTQINQVVLLGYGGWLVIQGEFPLGAGMFVFANLILEFASQVAQIVNIANTIQASLTAAERVYEVLDTPIEIGDAPDVLPLSRARGHIEFDHVTFGYDPDRPVLEDISCVIAPGECVGLTGPVGSGKTTFLSLLTRFYDVTAGQIRVDGEDIRRYRLNDLRRNAGCVFQESFLFSNTVAANIAFGKPTATLDEIQHAAELAAAREFIDGLPLRYDNLVGEHGANLSGGQRQRLAIARALLLDPPLLLLDDATAAVDAHTEHAIQMAIDRGRKQRTTLIVSGRVSTLKHCDRVIVLDDGRIIQTGTPEELLKQEGLFRELARRQSEDVWEDAGPVKEAG